MRVTWAILRRRPDNWMRCFRETRAQPYPTMTPDAPALTGRWTDVFRRDAALHMAIMSSIVAGTFQGWLKDHFGGPLPYAAADLLLMGAAILWFGSLALRHAPVRGPGNVPHIIFALIFVPMAFLLHPGTPITIEAAGLRAWVAFPVAGLIAMTTIRGRGQVEAYVRLILILCFITAVYGIWQYRQGPESALAGQLAQMRHGTTVFYNLGRPGEQEFRAFSTFTFPAPFAGMMVFGILLAAGKAMARNTSRRERWLMLLLIPLFFVGMTVSGTRAAIIILGLGLLVLAWYRGLSLGQVLLIPILLAALHIAALVTTGSILTRLESVASEGRLWTYVLAPVTIAARSLASDPFGLGLGRSGVGVPFQIFQSMPGSFWRGSDGDLGRAAVELGVFGVALLALLVFGLLPYAARAIRRLIGTPDEPYALGIGALVVSTGLVLLIGSPLTSAPHGTIWWFLLGALLQLQMQADDREEDEA